MSLAAQESFRKYLLEQKGKQNLKTAPNSNDILISEVATEVVVYFDLPFLLAVNDSLEDNALKAYIKVREANLNYEYKSTYQPTEWFKFDEFKNQHIVSLSFGVNTNYNHGVYYPSSFEPPYKVSLNNTVDIHLYFIARVNQNRLVPMFGYPIGDVAGKVMFSSVQAVLSFKDAQFFLREYLEDRGIQHGKHKQDRFNALNTSGDASTKVTDAHIFTSAAVRALNLFIDRYKIISDSYFLTNITTRMIGKSHVSFYDNKRRMIENRSGDLPHLSGYEENKLSAEQD
jgi:hypothetical protein